MSSTCEYIKRKWGDRLPIELAKAIAEAKALENGTKCNEKDYEGYKGYVNKWLKGEQEPGKYYLLALAEILNVSVESILKGEDVINRYGDRATAYSAALSGDERTIDRLFRNKECCEPIKFDTADEYGKTFVDYVIEFNNYQAFKIAVSKYPNKFDYDRLEPRVYNKLTKMIIENDDVEMFEKFFGYIRNELSLHAPYREYEITDDHTLAIIKSQKILRWFMKSKPFSTMEWDRFNNWLVEDEKVDNIPSVPYGFNKLLNKCVEENLMDTLEMLLDFSINHMECVIEILGQNISYFEIYNSSLVLKGKIRIVAALVPHLESGSENIPEKIQAKVAELNRLIDVIGRKNEKTKA